MIFRRLCDVLALWRYECELICRRVGVMCSSCCDDLRKSVLESCDRVVLSAGDPCGKAQDFFFDYQIMYDL